VCSQENNRIARHTRSTRSSGITEKFAARKGAATTSPKLPRRVLVETFGTLEALHPSRIDLGSASTSAARQRALTLIGRDGESSGASRRARRSLVSTTAARAYWTR
jgi:hypothetical protein